MIHLGLSNARPSAKREGHSGPAWGFLAGLSWLCGLFCGVGPALAQEAVTGEELYQKACASCHGKDLRGGQAQSLVDAIWQFGSGRNDILRNIKHGIPDFSMPAFATTLSDDQIRRILDFLQAAEKTAGVRKPPPPQKLYTLDYDVAVQIWIEGLNLPWGMVFLDGTRALVTERGGALRMVSNGVLQAAPVQGTPAVLHEGQGGLLDVAVDPKFADNGWIYLSYSHALPAAGGGRPPAMTRLVRGRIRDNSWTDEHVVFEAPVETYSSARHHYGSRTVFDPQGHLYFSIGDRGQAPQAQDLDRPNGKIHRLWPDGSIPDDNPFLNRPEAMPSLYTCGNRNPQGLAVHPVSGRVWAVEHGPMGGDELNLVAPGLNYGWPITTYGRDYSGAKISDFREKPGIEPPSLYWNPSIAVCGMGFVTGDLFPRWRNKLLVGALRYEEVRLLTLHENRVLHQEIILKSAGRVRTALSGPDGAIYVVLNGPDVILRLTPVRDVNEGPE
jgi:glucose/arabinose dehydrogenase